MIKLRDELADELIAHQRMDIGHCLCGWGVDAGNIGQSHARHVADHLIPIIISYPDRRKMEINDAGSTNST